MKPWNELGDTEKREAIARRLGWVKLASGHPNLRWIWHHPSLGAETTYEWCIPDWPTSDALAFTEVFPKITALMEAKIMGGPKGRKWIATEKGVSIGPTYADAICMAAYLLLPEAQP